jgi:hypothetical protein
MQVSTGADAGLWGYPGLLGFGYPYDRDRGRQPSFVR